ncbi:MAG: DEAD/DEAH box helicase [Hespellia sp.]|nr:DEAD/DEAH box helicase [Hespellia sp.]
MITFPEVIQTVGMKFYERGQAIAGTTAIQNIEIEDYTEDGYSYRTISAQVRGSKRRPYEVEVTIDEDCSEIVDSYCDCPAFYEYGGRCKHCAAVLVRYIQMRNSHRLTRKNKTTATNPALKELLVKKSKRAVTPMLQTSLAGAVRLEPQLYINSNEIFLEFKIGSTKLYVLKDVSALVDALDIQEKITYGKKLAFIPNLQVFDEQSRLYMEFISQYVKAIRRNSPYYYDAYPTRKIPLGNEHLDRFFEIQGELPFYLQIPPDEKEMWHMENRPPERTLKVIGEKEGASFEVNRLRTVATSNYEYSFKDQIIYRIPLDETSEIAEFRECVSKIPNSQCFIAKEDLPLFCRELLPALKKYYAYEAIDFDETTFVAPVQDFEIYLDMPQGNFITCKALAVYGGEKCSIFDGKALEDQRDYAEEMKVSTLISPYFNAFDEKQQLMVLADDEEMLYELLLDGIPRFQELGEVYISDALKKLQVISPPKVTVGVSLGGNLLELTIDSGEFSREQLVQILSRYEKKKKFYRLKNGSFITLENENMKALSELKQGLYLSGSSLKKESIQLPKYRALYLDAQLKEQQGIAAVKNKAFKSLIRNMKTVEENDFELPQCYETVLREYQKSGFSWLKTLAFNGFGGILADDMGLGKTLQVITFLYSEFFESDSADVDSRQALIVCPASLVYNWMDEFARFAPSIRAAMVIGTAAERKLILDDAKQERGKIQVLITSYDLLKRDLEEYDDMKFLCQVVDEAQYIKNHGTQAAKSVKMIEAGFKIALTGTPIENRLSELWSIFDYVMPGFLSTYQKFKEEYEIPIVQNQNNDSLRRLQKMIRPFILRRLKGEVLKDLPDKLEKNMFAKLSGEQQEIYQAHVQRLRLSLENQSDEEFKGNKLQILAELTKLRQICCNPALIFDNYKKESAKEEVCLELIKAAIDGGHKILLFSQFTTMLGRLTERLKKEGISYFVLTGATPKIQRARMVSEFQEDDTSVFCISLKAGGTGLNLTAADIVIHYDPWWNVAVQNQATDRVHRIGQKNQVTVYKVIAKDTIEEQIVKLQEKKQELADQILSGSDMGSAAFNREELLQLLGK